MTTKLKIPNLLLLGFWLFLPLAVVQASTDFSAYIKSPTDTVKYKGYRLDLYQFELLKKTDDWIKVRFSAVNTGRMDVDLGREGTEHWVQINYDRSIFDEKLGGYREHIKYQLAKDGFKLPISGVAENVELKFPAILPAKARQTQREQVAKKKKTPSPVPSSTGASRPEIFIAPVGGADEMPVHPEFAKKEPAPTPEIAKEVCPDIRFEDLRIIQQDNKSATLQYTIINDGDAGFKLFETKKGKEDGLIIRAYISGVSTLSRGALPVDVKFIQPTPGVANKLEKGDRYQARIKLDVRKKTRYMKSLILKLDGSQYAAECDRTNNTAAVVLD